MLAAERDRLLAKARDALASALPEAWAIYVYGSFGRGDDWPESDLDLAVLLPPGHTLGDRFDLASRISRVVGREVDLADLRRAGLDLVREVMRDGRPLRVQSEADTLAWEAEQMTAYADFEPRRAALLSLYLREPLTGPS
ncbi:MAG: type VII toxin-antitoxin system MntA family adenylyltransferase antitoxin [Steroidobacteraceae bacterium]